MTPALWITVVTRCERAISAAAWRVACASVRSTEKCLSLSVGGWTSSEITS